jgi:hypothetical protein
MARGLLDNNAATIGDASNGHLNGGERENIRRGIHVMHEFQNGEASKGRVEELGAAEHEVGESAAGRVAGDVLATVGSLVLAGEGIVCCTSPCMYLSVRMQFVCVLLCETGLSVCTGCVGNLANGFSSARYSYADFEENVDRMQAWS